MNLEKILFPNNLGFSYAEPDEEHVAELMRFVYEHPDIGEKKGGIAREEIISNHSYSAVAQQTRNALEGLKYSDMRRTLLPEDIFLNMYPVYFAGKEENLGVLDMDFSKKQLNSIAIYGTGKGGEFAYRWVSRFKEIKIVFLDRKKNVSTYLNCKVYNYENFNFHNIDLVLIGTQPNYVPEILENLKRVSSVPVYLFGP